MISLILLSLLPLLISGVISYSESTRAIQKNTRIFSTEMVKQVAKNVRLQMAQIETSSQELVLSRPVQLALTQYLSNDPIENSPARAELTRILLEAYGSFDYINQKYFLGTDQRILDSQTFPHLGNAVEQLVTHAPHLEGKPVWTILSGPSRQKSIVMLREIYFTANARPAGTLFLGLRTSHFSSVFDNVDLGANSNIFILDVDSGDILVKTRTQAGLMSADRSTPELLAAIRQGDPRHDSAGFINFDLSKPADDGKTSTGKVVAAYATIPHTTWAVVSTIPYKNLVAEAQSVRNKIVVIGCICFIFSIGLAYLIARSISDPLEKLIAIMKQAETGNYALRVNSEGQDELTVLSQKFNEMANWIDRDQEQLELRVSERTFALEAANKQLAALSMTDSLTGIANRRCFDDILIKEMQRAARNGEMLAVMMIDVDFFKSYNDYYGHQDGDICLRRVAEVLHSQVRRATELVARYGGEEFVMLVPDTDNERALLMAETIRRTVADLALPHAQSPLVERYITISVGLVVMVPDARYTPSSFIRMADQAMYQAKR